MVSVEKSPRTHAGTPIARDQGAGVVGRTRGYAWFQVMVIEAARP